MTLLIPMSVINRRNLTADIAEFSLAAGPSFGNVEMPSDMNSLPPALPGAHITVQTPCGAMRRYSLVNTSAKPENYIIAVKRESDSRGGSASMHSDLHQGDGLLVQLPENDFPLTEANDYLLIAGGIGITPIYAMVQQLVSEGAEFRLIYCTRSIDQTAYAKELQKLCGERLHLHHDQGDVTNAFDFWELLETPRKTQVYCCGPQPLMEEVRALSGHWPDGFVHYEDFKPTEVVRADDVEFAVTLKKSGTTLQVPADRTILETVREAGLSAVSSCESGTCGSCKCVVIEGDVDHRDQVLMEDEKSSHIMICVSRARGDSLVLDL